MKLFALTSLLIFLVGCTPILKNTPIVTDEDFISCGERGGKVITVGLGDENMTCREPPK